MTFSFANPILAVFALAFPVLAFAGNRQLRRLGFRNALTLSLNLGPPAGESFRGSKRLALLTAALSAAEALAVSAFLLAAAGPELSHTDIQYLTRGPEIIFVLDISPSMAGLDMTVSRGGALERESRYDASRALLVSFAGTHPSSAIGLAALGSEAALLLPPTTDRNALLERLETLQLGELGDGTALGLGLSIAALHIKGRDFRMDTRIDSHSRPVVVLITDGENNAGEVHPETAAALIADWGAAFYVIGLGSSGEVPIDYTDPVTGIRRAGSFDSRFDTEQLRAIAAAGQGLYMAAPSSAAFNAAFERLSENETTVTQTRGRTRRQSVDTAFLLAAIFLAAASRFTRRYLLGALL